MNISRYIAVSQTDPQQCPIYQTPPKMFSLARNMIRHHIRGGYRLWNMLHKNGALNCTVCYDIKGPARTTQLFVPLYREVSSKSRVEIEQYEKRVIEAISTEIKNLQQPIHFIDCGADIGMVTTALLRQADVIARVDAFEPNPEAFLWLEKTLQALDMAATTHPVAISDWTGKGRLMVSSRDTSAHAAFITPDDQGDIDVCRLDDILKSDGNSIILKIDVEGAELNVLKSATQLLSTAPSFIIVFEAHKDVVSRTRLDPMTIYKLINDIKPSTFKIAELPDFIIDPDTPFFDQVPAKSGVAGKDILNIICTSINDH